MCIIDIVIVHAYPIVHRQFNMAVDTEPKVVNME